MGRSRDRVRWCTLQRRSAKTNAPLQHAQHTPLQHAQRAHRRERMSRMRALYRRLGPIFQYPYMMAAAVAPSSVEICSGTACAQLTVTCSCPGS